jgi:hypothetical protein
MRCITPGEQEEKLRQKSLVLMKRSTNLAFAGRYLLAPFGIKNRTIVHGDDPIGKLRRRTIDGQLDSRSILQYPAIL